MRDTPENLIGGAILLFACFYFQEPIQRVTSFLYAWLGSHLT